MELFFLFLSLALILSFVCSLLEATLLSVNSAFIESKISEGKKYAVILKKFKNNIDLPLAAILTFNTAANTLGAAGVGAQSQLLWGNEYVSVISALLTLVILLFSEIIPKTLGAIYWRQLVHFTTISLIVLIYSPLFPFIVLCRFVARLISKKDNNALISRAEFQAIAEKGISEGLFKEEESKILMNLIRFNKIIVRSIMTPRTVMVTANEDQTISAFQETVGEIKVSRIPVFKESIDNITGFVLKDEILQNIIDNTADNSLSSIKREIITVSEQTPIIKLFTQLLQTKQHIAIVVGEYGETSGLVTMEDIIETLIGMEIMDEKDNIADLQLQARRNWENRAKRMKNS